MRSVAGSAITLMHPGVTEREIRDPALLGAASLGLDEIGDHLLSDVQSGIGVVHNALLLAQAERTVVRGPFRPSPRSLVRGEWSLSPKPPWFVSNRTAATTGRRLVDFHARPRWSALPGIFASALRLTKDRPARSQSTRTMSSGRQVWS
ncbi:hypothetical protein [Streptomyces sp. KL116D]|uniref:hypothetical protein n=1 Tax=Streptomyces sp. KL116D TaxID=3045152 RepID=UPI003555ED65